MPTTPNTYQSPGSSSFSLNDFYYIVFRHKWKIVLCSILGLLAAAAIFLFTPVSYRSQAKLLVRYVTETATVDPAITGNRMLTPDSRGANIINTELHILTSQDVIGTVIDKIGEDELAASQKARRGPRTKLREALRKLRLGAEYDKEEGKNDQFDRSQLAQMIIRGLQVENPKNTNIIRLEYHSSSPALAQLTLKTLIDAYLNKHYEIHRSVAAYGFLAKQVDQTRSRLTQTEEELRPLEERVGFSSVKEADTALSAGRGELQQQIWRLEGELAGVVAESGIIEKWKTSGGSIDIGTADPAPSIEMATPAIRGIGPGDPMDALRKREAALLSIFTEDSSPIKELRAEIARTTKRSESVSATNGPGSTQETSVPAAINAGMDPYMLNAQARIASLQARITALRGNLQELVTKGTEDHSLASRILELQRKQEIEEANYRYFSQGLERAKIDASLDAEKLANISIVEPATSPAGFWRSQEFFRNILAALALGIFGGLGLAFFTEKIADHSIRQPTEVETVLSAPLLLTIPHRTSSRSILSMRRGEGTMKLLPAHDGNTEYAKGKSSSPEGRSWTLQSDLKPYFEALRDRVVAFEKTISSDAPCLLGITSCLHRSGTTTMAAGLALTLARNGDGRVLFVDLSDLDHRSGNSLLDHAENVSLADIFADDTGRTTIMQPNLFVLSAKEVTDEPQPIKASPRMEEVIGQLKQSEYDYVVLDLPPISETSPALRIAPLIDGIVLIIEAEKVARETAQKARKLLDHAQACVVGAILNRKRQYVPRWLEQGGS